MVFVGISGLVFLLDYFLKRKAEEKLNRDTVKSVAGNKILLRKIHNNGIAFGLFAGNEQVTVMGTAIVIGAMIAKFFETLNQKGRTVTKLGYALLIGGGANNLFERISKGCVTDYFSFNVKWEKLKKLVFNISDIFIFIGAILIVIGNAVKKK